MASPAQIAANRRNAQHSTGPRTTEYLQLPVSLRAKALPEEGQATVRLNSLVHGLRAQEVLLPDEDPAVFEELRESFHQQFNPEGPAELFCIEKMLLSFWRNRRIGRIEADLYRHFYPTEAQAEKIAFGSLGQSFTIDGLGQDNFSRLARYETSLDRAFYRASKELQALQKVRIGFARQNEKEHLQNLQPAEIPAAADVPSEIGFARQNGQKRPETFQPAAIPPRRPFSPKLSTGSDARSHGLAHSNRKQRRQARLQGAKPTTPGPISTPSTYEAG